jgi:hypothetical protein
MLSTQIIWLFVLAIPIGCIAWTVTHEEIFSAMRTYCTRQSKENKNPFLRKCFYMLTCEYCFSHYVTIFFLLITRYTLLLPGWRGYLIAGFALVWIANLYMSLFALLRQAIKAEKTKIELEEKIIDKQEEPDGKTNVSNGKRTLVRKTMTGDYWKDI